MGRASEGARPSRRNIDPAEEDMPRAALRKKARSGRERERLDVSSRGMMYCIVLQYVDRPETDEPMNTKQPISWPLAPFLAMLLGANNFFFEDLLAATKIRRSAQGQHYDNHEQS